MKLTELRITNFRGLGGVHNVIDGDTDIDILSASSMDNKIMWYENDGSQQFKPYIITTSAEEAYNVFAIDMDGDTDVDVLSASWEDDKIAWYMNMVK